MRLAPGPPEVCLIKPLKSAYSETFIQAHLDRLPARVACLYGQWFPTRRADDRRLLPLPLYLLKNGVRAAARGLGLVSEETAAGVARNLDTRGLAHYLRRNRVATVLAEYGPTGAAVAEACQRARVPLVTHFHGFDAHDRRILAEYGAAYGRMFAAAGAVVAVSRDMERQLLGLGCPREKLHYNPYGVDPEVFAPAAAGANPPRFLAVGRFVDKKAPHLTLLAFRQVAASQPEARLQMIGDGDLCEACKQLARSLGLGDKVEFLGPRAHAEVAAAMRQARAFVQHSVTTSWGDMEGTPVAVLEAGAAALPVVATRHAGLQEAVVHGKTGFLVAEGDVDGMAVHMLALARDPDLAAHLGRRGREHICTKFSMARSIGRLWEIMARLIQPG